MSVPLEYISVTVLETLLDQVPETMFFVKDTRLRYVSVNQALLRRSGKRHKTEVLGRTAAELFPPPLSDNYTAQDAEVISKGSGIADQLEMYLLPGGVPGWCLTYKMALRDSDGAVTGLCGISRDLPVPDVRGALYQRLIRALETIQEDYGQPLRISELSRLAGLSEDRFTREVVRIFGLTPKQLLIKTRLSAASDLLLQPELTISQIAAQCGYIDHSAFARQFRRVANISPVQFRKLANARRVIGMKESS
ncbi:AraC family transcriptional regulator (plasmid) [Deinococcus radiomollis]|uniref:AraC family transcriptional regulator n=1 Tax=Deinococcus radiomollis TaxID=468916 RepID=UPI0038914EA3